MDVSSVLHRTSGPAQICATTGAPGFALRRLLSWHMLGPVVYLYLYYLYFDVLEQPLLTLATGVAIREALHIVVASICCVW
eukprot:COSAG05_NODE_13610_length_423_cov_1.706790_1_plen_81_part_00